MVGRVLAVNTVIDEDRSLSYVNYGEVVASHRLAVELVQRFAVVSVRQRFRTVVTSAAGYPLDTTFYQTVKGMVGPIEILEPGGNLIVASECSEGMGSRAYVDAQRRMIALGPDRFLEEIGAKQFAASTSGRPRCSSNPCGSAASTSTRAASHPPTAR